MKNRLAVSVATLLSAAGLAHAQFTESFDVLQGGPGPAPLYPAGWFAQNNSGTTGTSSWFQGNTAVFAQFEGTGYIGANFNNTTLTNTISNWLVTPIVTLTNGSTLTFYTRTVDAVAFPDRLQVRMNQVNTGTNVGAGPNDVGDFTDLLLDINPTYTLGTTPPAGYPNTWTQITATVTGVTGSVQGRLAFRYFVENGGPNGLNSDYIGIDLASYTPAGTPTGRCCFTDGSCQVIAQASCTASGGTYAGNGTSCTPNVCPQPATGACCFANGSCQVLTQAQCVAQTGTYAGDNVTCAAANCPQPPAGGEVFAVNVRGAVNLIKFPVNAPAYNIVGPSVVGFALDFNGNGSSLYYITNPGQQLGTIDQTSGAFTPIATISGAGAAEANWGGMTFDASTNTMYAIGIAAGVTNLYTVDLTTGVTTLVAPITGLPTGHILIDFSINQGGTLMVGHDIATDQMFSIDKTTGAATVIGPTGFAANFAQGMDFDPTTGDLYAAIYTGGGTGQFCRVNTTTGACTSLANTQPWNAPNGAELEMAIKGAAVVPCYADCDGVGGLTANDFACFLLAYTNNASYADCDGVGGLTANDFACFLLRYTNGCS